MNYRHIFHAGNFADLLKHLVLIACLKNLHKKETPFHVLDAFAGIGLYDLDSLEAQKSKEHDSGIEKILSSNELLPDLLNDYKNLVLKYRTNTQKLYPGSPLIISEYLRSQDRGDFCELHPDDFYSLKRNMYKIENSFVHPIDGYIGMKSMTPPKEKRGIILIDPPFEERDEFEKIIRALEVTCKRYNAATIIIWYPIKEIKKVQNFYKSLAEFKKEILKIELSLDSSSTNLKSTGVLIINPPFIKDELNLNLAFLKDKIYSNKAKFNISN